MIPKQFQAVFLRFCLLFSLLFIGGFSNSQGIIISEKDTAIHRPVTGNSAYLRMLTPVSIDSVTKLNGLFEQSPDEPVLIFNYDRYYYWFRFIVNNKTQKDQQLRLVMAPTGLNEGRMFQRVNNEWKEVAVSGLRTRYKNRSYQFSHYTFPFTAGKAKEDTIYLSIDASNLYKSFGFSLLHPKPLKLFENKIYFVFGILIGLLILFFIINISLFIYLKEKLHLWYALYIFLLIIVVLKNDQLEQEFLRMDSENAFRYFPYIVVGALAIAVLMHVVQYFLKSKLQENKLLFKGTTLFKINTIASALFFYIVFITSQNVKLQLLVLTWIKLSTLFGILVIIIICIYCVIKGFKGAMFPLLGSLVFMVGSIQRLFFPSTLSFLFPPTTFHIGIILEVFIISLGLTYRYWWEREFQRKKESQYQQSFLQSQLEIQEQTFKNISQEIHDNIGQALTLAKLNLNTMPSVTDTQKEKIFTTKEIISKTIADLRDLSRSLNTDYIADMGLQKAIGYELNLVARSSAIKTEIITEGTPIGLNKQKELILFRVLQEVLNNAIKHAEPQNITAKLTYKDDVFELLITDNGKGFVMRELQNEKQSRSGLGLRNMENRAKLIGASFSMNSKPGNGTEVRIILPLLKNA